MNDSKKHECVRCKHNWARLIPSFSGEIQVVEMCNKYQFMCDIALKTCDGPDLLSNIEYVEKLKDREASILLYEKEFKDPNDQFDEEILNDADDYIEKFKKKRDEFENALSGANKKE